VHCGIGLDMNRTGFKDAGRKEDNPTSTRMGGIEGGLDRLGIQRFPITNSAEVAHVITEG